MALFDRSASECNRMKEAGNIEGLLDLLCRADPGQRPSIATALLSMGTPAIKAAAGRLSSGDTTEALAHALASPGIAVLPALLHLVSRIPGEPAVVIADDLARAGNEAFEALMPAMMHENPALRKGAAVVLGSIARKNMDALLALRQMCRDPDRGVRQEAGEALVRTGWEPDDDMEKAYLFFIREKWSDCVRMKKAAVPVLLEAASDPDPNVKIPALRALGKIHDVRAVPVLKKGLADGDGHVRSAAAEAMGELGDGQQVPDLVRALTDPYPQVRMEAAWALDRLGWKPQTDRQQIRYLIAKEQWNTLAQLGRPAIQPLIEVLEEAHSGVRSGAVEALRKIGKPAHEALAAAVQVESRCRQEAARRAISSIKQKNEEDAQRVRRSEDNAETYQREYRESIRARERYDAERIRQGVPPGRPEAAGPSGRPLPPVSPSPEEVRNLQAMIRESERKVREGLAAVERGKQQHATPPPAPSAASGEGPTPEDIRAMESRMQERFDAIEREEWRHRQAAASRESAAGEDAGAAHAEAPETPIDFGPRKGMGMQPEEEEAVPEDPMAALLRALRSKDEGVRAAAIESIRDMGDAGREYLIGALLDENYAVRIAAAEALGEIGSQKGVGPLIQVLRDQYEDVRIAAIISLGMLKNPLSISFIIELFRDEYSGVRFAAADAVAEFGEAALGPLTAALGNGDVLVRITAARSFTRLAHLKSIPTLIEHLGDEVKDVRWGVSQALAEIGVPAVMPLTWVLKKGTQAERLAALDALGTIYDDRASEAILIALQDEDEVVRDKASRVLKKREILNVWREAWLKRVETEEQPQLIGAMQEVDAREFADKGQKEIANLIHALKERNGSSQVAASMRLMMMGRPAVEGLIRALRDEDHDTRVAAAEILGEMREVAVDPLMGALRDTDTFVRTVAARNLGKIGSERSIDALIEALHAERNYKVRAVIAEALGYMGNRRSIDPLIIALRDRDEEVQMAAAHSLGYIGDRKAIEPLIQALNDVDYRVRHVALEALKDPSGVPQDHLVNALKFGEKEFKQGVAEALDMLGWTPRNETEHAYYLIGKGRWGELDRLGRAAIGPVTEAMQDDSVDIRLVAMKAVSRIGGTDAVQPLIAALADPAPAVRMGAERALVEIGGGAIPKLQAAASLDTGKAGVIDRIVAAINERRAAGSGPEGETP
ncbi:MAG: HEAT repeat domain-containing protein [Methanomicrobiales archaeon]|nr:HEAT repeat domain-containing protein [Methanomicrobiales archaeon]